MQDIDDGRLVCIRAKFQEFGGTQPLGAVVTACDNFCATLLSPNDKDNNDDHSTKSRHRRATTRRIRRELENTSLLGTQAKNVLCQVVPSLQAIFYPNKNAVPTTAAIEVSRTSSSSSDPNLYWNRLQYALQTFLRALGTADHALILVLDDLQWADPVSLDLVTSLLHAPHVWVLGAARPHPELLDDKLLCQQHLVTERIEIDNLMSTELHNVVTELLNVKPSADTQALADWLYDRTRGNFFFCKEMLQDMEVADLKEMGITKVLT